MDLERHLKNFSSKEYAENTKLGCFSAASNVTGVITDVNKLCVLMHKYNGLAFFDYACGGPYLDIDMNPILDNIE